VLTTVRQLAEVLCVCRASRSLAEAGRVLFNHSRTQKASANDSHRLKQYLQKLGLEFQGIVKKRVTNQYNDGTAYLTWQFL
jgi:transcriptional regulatory protein RtcR